MNRKTAKLLTSLIPSERYRRLLRWTLSEAPSARPVDKCDCPAAGSTYRELVVPRGFGHSGSGVIGDLLSEYDGTTVFGGADPDGSGRWAHGKQNVTSFEVDILKMYGGVADLASAFGASRPWGKFKLLNFIHDVEFLYRQRDIPIYDRRFLRRSRAFVDELVEARWTSDTPMAENMPFEMHAMPPDGDPDLQNPLYGWRKAATNSYVMKDLTEDEYMAIARRYMADILSWIPSADILVLDQLFSADLSLDLCERYVGPFKEIAVYRDPRDVFCTGFARNMPWIPNEPSAFVAWYRGHRIDRLLALEDPRLLVLRFEDLVLSYEQTVARVEAYVGLRPEAHVRARAAFDPSRSAKNIGLWKAFPNQDTMAKIADALPQYCHNG